MTWCAVRPRLPLPRGRVTHCRHHPGSGSVSNHAVTDEQEARQIMSEPAKGAAKDGGSLAKKVAEKLQEKGKSGATGK